MRPALAAGLLLVAAAAAPVRAADDDVHYHLGLALRFTDVRNRPSPDVLFDVGQRAFAVDRYFAPAAPDTYPSAILSAGAEGHHGWFRWGFLADSGEVREQTFPRIAAVCVTRTGASPSRLDVVGSGNCDLLPGSRYAAPVEETRPGAAQLTANGRPIEDEARETWFVREAWVGAVYGRNDFAVTRLGRKRITVGDGFVYDDYGTGAEASFDLGALGPSWEVGAAAFYPSRDLPSGSGWGSLFFTAHANYLPSLFEHAGVFAAYFRDRSGSTAQLFQSSAVEPWAVALQQLAPGDAGYAAHEVRLLLALSRTFGGDADIGWAGTSGNLVLGPTRLEWTGALAFGEIPVLVYVPTATNALGVLTSEQASLLGQLAHLRLRVPLGAFELGGFFLYESGDEPPSSKADRGAALHYGGFLGVAPYVTDTNLFFQGGVSESFASRQASAPGVNARGVLAPGLVASWDPAPSFGVDLRGAFLAAPAAGPYGGSIYGEEVDLNVTWAASTWLTLEAEGDVLFPGDFFPTRTPVTKVVLGADLVAF